MRGLSVAEVGVGKFGQGFSNVVGGALRPEKFHPYYFAVLIFLVAGVVALHRLSAQATLHIPVEPKQEAQPITDDSPDSPWGYFRPEWRGSRSWSLILSKPDIRDALADPGTEIRRLVDDPKARIEPEFHVPSSLRDRVVFWMEIYSRYNSHTRVVHDRNNPTVVYGLLDFRPLYRQMGNGIPTEVKANAIEKKVLKQLKARIEEAAGITSTKILSPQERVEIQSFLSRLGASSKSSAQALVDDIRTQSGQSDFFLQALYRSRNLLPHIESVFQQSSLPIALGRIPFVESSFNSRALSKGGALGIWQFMPDTARQMIHSKEEKSWSDPLKQTESAARLLKMYRSLLPDWGTTISSYNSGVGRVGRLVKKYKVKDVEGLLKIPDPEGLGFAGKNFYSEFLAANLVEAYKEELFQKALEPADFSLVFKGTAPFPKDYCDL